jgi:parvulin-like peptidyl-prolyl isomerase
MTFATLLLALAPLAQGSPIPVGDVGEPFEVDQLIAIVNDQVLTFSQVAREVKEIARERAVPEDTPGFFGAIARNQLVDMLFREGYRQAGMEEGILEEVVNAEMARRIEAAGSVAAFELMLAKRDSSLEIEKKRTGRMLVGMYFRQAELGRGPQLGSSAFQTFLTASPNEIHAYYQEHRGKFHRKREVEARILMVPKGDHSNTEVFLRELRQMSGDSDAFAKVAAEQSIFRAENHNLTGLVNPSETSYAPSLKDFLLNGAEGELSQPLELQTAWVLVQMIRVNPERDLTLGEAHIEIEEKILDRKRKQVLQNAIDRLKKRCYMWTIPDLDGLLDDVYGLHPIDEEEL